MLFTAISLCFGEDLSLRCIFILENKYIKSRHEAWPKQLESDTEIKAIVLLL